MKKEERREEGGSDREEGEDEENAGIAIAISSGARSLPLCISEKADKIEV